MLHPPSKVTLSSLRVKIDNYRQLCYTTNAENDFFWKMQETMCPQGGQMGAKMKKTIYKSRAIQAVIVIVALCLLVSLWPLRIWRERITSSVPVVTGTLTEAIDGEKTLLQTITAQYSHMDTISVYLDDSCTGERFYLRILDEQWQPVCEELTVIDYGKLPGYQEVLIDIDMEVGKTYHVILQGEESSIYVGCENVSPESAPFLAAMYYADSTQEGMGLAADYNYSVPLRKTWVFLYGALILGIAAGPGLGGHFWYKKRDGHRVRVEKVFKVVMNPLVAAGTVLGLGTVLLGLWGPYTLDNTVYFISILLLAGILFYGINHNRKGVKPIITLDYLRSHAMDLVQSAAIAGAIAGCCEYVSGLYDIHHTVAERKEMLWFAIAIIAFFEWKEIVNIYNLIYLIGACGYGYYYYRSHLTEEMDQLGVLALKLTVWVGILLGLILVRTVIGLWKRKLAKPCFWYAGILGLFFALVIIFRNGRWWGVAMVVSFTLFYLSYGMWGHRGRILVNIASGVVVQFLLSTGYALLHRPYVSYRNARYTHIFHTVTITAAYLTMVECVAIVMVLAKLAKGHKLKHCWKELVFFGVVSSYMIFTMSRTAFFAVGATMAFAIVFLSAGRGSRRVQNMGRNLGMLFGAVLVCFPVTFTLQRNLPALVSEPYLYEIEYSMYCPEDVMRGRRIGSLNFMRVGRFIDVFGEKILGIPEGTFDVYGELALYQELYGDEGEDSARAEELDAGGPATQDGLLVASADYVPEGIPEGAEKENDFTNGRLDIFRSYMEQLNMTGHQEMGALLENGEIATHAHNIYLQLAYDHGIPTGIVFVLTGIATFVSAWLYYRRKKDKITYAALPVVAITAMAVAGMVEWVFHVSNPFGFLLMLVITPLLFQNEG